MTAYWANPNVLTLLRIEREMGRPKITALPTATCLLPWDEIVRQGFRDVAAGRSSPFLKKNPSMQGAWNMIRKDFEPLCQAL